MMLLLFIVFLVVIWILPQLMLSPLSSSVEDPVKLAELEDTYRSTIAQTLGGIAIIAGLYLTHKRVSATENNLLITREGQITERFTRAIEHLGKEQLEFKLGGIYALERIANESEKDYWPIVEILCAYVRKNSPKMIGTVGDFVTIDKNKVSMDAQAALDVLVRLSHNHEKKESRKPLDLSNTCLIEAVILKANFPNVRLSNSNLYKSEILGCNFKGSNLEEADISESNLYGINLENSNLCLANIKKATLREANLENSLFIGTNLEEADFMGSNLSICIFCEANLQKSLFSMANLTGAAFCEINVPSNKRLNEMINDLSLKENLFLSGANLEEADFSEANLEGADFRGTNLVRANFSHANLKGTTFRNSNIKGSNFENANLANSNLMGINLNEAKFDGANLRGAIIDYTDD